MAQFQRATDKTGTLLGTPPLRPIAANSGLTWIVSVNGDNLGTLKNQNFNKNPDAQASEFSQLIHF